jgi:hypothetical protein
MARNDARKEERRSVEEETRGLLATVMMLGVMSVSPALVNHDVDHHFNNGHKIDDGADHDADALG